MNKSGNLGMGLHQALSFSKPMMRVSRGEAVFWPGCALMGLAPAILERTRQCLERAEPGIGLSSCCCGQPSRYLFPGAHQARQEKLRRRLEQQGVKRIYTACPNCTQELEGLGEYQVLPIWPVLAEHVGPEDIQGPGGPATLHDPCPMRKDAICQQAVRRLLALADVTLTEAARCGENTRCCGNFHMMRALDPDKSRVMRQARLGDLPAGLPIVSYCEGCLDAFRGEGRRTIHVLELLFGQSQSRGWGNRWAFTRKGKA